MSDTVVKLLATHIAESMVKSCPMILLMRC